MDEDIKKTADQTAGETAAPETLVWAKCGKELYLPTSSMTTKKINMFFVSSGFLKFE